MGHYILYTKGAELWLEEITIDIIQAEQALESLEELVCAGMGFIAVSVVEAI